MMRLIPALSRFGGREHFPLTEGWPVAGDAANAFHGQFHRSRVMLVSAPVHRDRTDPLQLQGKNQLEKVKIF